MTAPDRYAVIGNPIAHSKSPDIHAAFSDQTGQTLTYERLLAPLDGFVATVQSFIAQGGLGMNVTVPFKLEAFALANTLTPRAQAAGAVNTLKFAAGDILGDNTDGVGLVRDLTRQVAQLSAASLQGKRILLLGAGGAARGVILPLLEQAPLSLVLANRTLSKAQDLVETFQTAAQQHGVLLNATEFTQLTSSFDCIINATAGSLQGEMPPLPDAVWQPNTLAYDMMYGAQPTVFMQAALAHGAQAADGLGMLVEQAAESFYLWRGVRPDTAPVLQQLRASLQGKAA